jgi:hypothetical protein
MRRILAASALIVAGGLACSCFVPLLAVLAGTGAGVWLARQVDPVSGLWLGSFVAFVICGLVWFARTGRVRRRSAALPR